MEMLRALYKTRDDVQHGMMSFREMLDEVESLDA